VVRGALSGSVAARDRIRVLFAVRAARQYRRIRQRANARRVKKQVNISTYFHFALAQLCWITDRIRDL